MEQVPASAPKASILVVDDDVFLSGLFGEFIARGGYAVTYARDGVEGLEHAETLKYDLILMDVMMPRMDGFEALERLKANPATKDIPVMMLTSMSQPEDVERGLNTGAVAYMEKQKMIPHEVYGKIAEALRSRPKRAEASKSVSPAETEKTPAKKPRKTRKKL